VSLSLSRIKTPRIELPPFRSVWHDIWSWARHHRTVGKPSWLPPTRPPWFCHSPSGRCTRKLKTISKVIVTHQSVWDPVPQKRCYFQINNKNMPNDLPTTLNTSPLMFIMNR
jgi:hypothetical protein